MLHPPCSANNQFNAGFGGCGTGQGNSCAPRPCCGSTAPPVSTQVPGSSDIDFGYNGGFSPNSFSSQGPGMPGSGSQGTGDLMELLNQLIQLISRLLGNGTGQSGGASDQGFMPRNFSNDGGDVIGGGEGGGSGGTYGTKQPPTPPFPPAPPAPGVGGPAAPNQPPQTGGPGSTSSTSGDYSSPPHGYAKDWNTIRFSNTTNEPVTVQITMHAGQPLPKGPDGQRIPGSGGVGHITLQPGQHLDLTFDPGTGGNFRSTKGDGSVWNQGEVFFDEKTRTGWGNMSYIHGANSNMRMFCQDGKHSGYLGDLFANAPPGIKVGSYGIMAPYDGKSDDPNDPNSGRGGPNGPKNAGADYLYSVLQKGEGYVHRGRPKEGSDYDDASSLRFTGPLAVVF